MVATAKKPTTVVPWVIVVKDDRTSPYRLPEIGKYRVQSTTHQQVRLDGYKNQWKTKVYCCESQAIYEEAQRLHRAFQSALDALANYLREMGSYTNRAKEFGAIVDKNGTLTVPKKAKNPIVPWVISAQDPDYERSLTLDLWEVYPRKAEREKVVSHSPQMIRVMRCFGSGPECETITTQHDTFCCPDDVRWERYQSLHQAAVEASEALVNYFCQIRTYEQAEKGIASIPIPISIPSQTQDYHSDVEEKNPSNDAFEEDDDSESLKYGDRVQIVGGRASQLRFLFGTVYERGNNKGQVIIDARPPEEINDNPDTPNLITIPAQLLEKVEEWDEFAFISLTQGEIDGLEFRSDLRDADSRIVYRALKASERNSKGQEARIRLLKEVLGLSPGDKVEPQEIPFSVGDLVEVIHALQSAPKGARGVVREINPAFEFSLLVELEDGGERYLSHDHVERITAEEAEKPATESEIQKGDHICGTTVDGEQVDGIVSKIGNKYYLLEDGKVVLVETATLIEWQENRPLPWTFIPDFMHRTEADAWLEWSRDEVQWKQNSIRMFGKPTVLPRLEAIFGDGNYTYNGLTLEAQPWTDDFRELRDALEQEIGYSFQIAIGNQYRDGDDHIGWHSDDSPEMGPRPAIASLSLGATRKFQLRNKATKEIHTFELTHGSLFVMHPGCQEEWQHRIVKTAADVDLRINWTFRPLQNVSKDPTAISDETAQALAEAGLPICKPRIDPEDLAWGLKTGYIQPDPPAENGSDNNALAVIESAPQSITTEPADLRRLAEDICQLWGETEQALEVVASAEMSALESARLCGELLIQAKQKAGHGNWEAWREDNICHPKTGKPLPSSTAALYQRVCQHWSKLQELQVSSLKQADKALRSLKAEKKPKSTTVVNSAPTPEQITPIVDSQTLESGNQPESRPQENPVEESSPLAPAAPGEPEETQPEPEQSEQPEAYTPLDAPVPVWFEEDGEILEGQAIASNGPCFWVMWGEQEEGEKRGNALLWEPPTLTDEERAEEAVVDQLLTYRPEQLPKIKGEMLPPNLTNHIDWEFSEAVADRWLDVIATQFGVVATVKKLLSSAHEKDLAAIADLITDMG